MTPEKLANVAAAQVRNVAIAVRDLANNSGVARNAQEQVRMFRAMGLDVDVYAERVNAELMDLGDATVHRLPRWPLPRPWRRRAFDIRVRRRNLHGPEVLVISHGDVVTRDVLFIHNCAHLAHEILNGNRLPNSDPVGRIHTRAITEPGLRLLVAGSRMAACDLSQRFDLDPERIAILYQTYSADTFNPHQRAELRRIGRDRLGITESVRLAGLVTSGDFRKRNVEGLLRAACLVASDIHWLIVGKDRHQKYYEQRARELGIAGRVHFQPVVRDVAQYYHAIDLFVLPAHIEEFGRSAIEAMACATPVVLGPNVGCAELLTGNARRGILDDIQPETIARTVNGLLDDVSALEETGWACAQIAPNYSEQRHAERLLNLLHARLPGRFPSDSLRSSGPEPAGEHRAAQ